MISQVNINKFSPYENKMQYIYQSVEKMVFIHFLLYIDWLSKERLCFIKGTELILVGLENKVQGNEE